MNKLLLCVLLAVTFPLVVTQAVMYHDDGADLAPTDHTEILEAGVAELHFTRDWFVSDGQAAANKIAAGSALPLPCPRPSTTLSLAFGIGYDSVETTVDSTTCWVEQQHTQAANLDVKYMKSIGAQVVHGAGVSELLIAAITALTHSMSDAGRPVLTVHEAPYYAVLRTVALSDALRGVVDWAEPNDVVAGKYAGRPLIIVAITPNNPSGFLSPGMLPSCRGHPKDPRKLTCFGSAATVIADHSFLWPCFLHEAPVNRTTYSEWDWNLPLRPVHSVVSLFGLSKLSGHAGTRHGWAWVLDKQLAASMRRELWARGTTLSAPALAHSSLILAAMTSSATFHSWCRGAMHQRWEQLHAAIAPAADAPACLALQTAHGSAVALLECLKKDRGDCARQLRNHGVLASRGTSFGASAMTARISMGGTDEQFKKLMVALRKMCEMRTAPTDQH